MQYVLISSSANGDSGEVHDHERNNELLLKYGSITSDIIIDDSFYLQEQEENRERLKRITDEENSHFKLFCLFIVIIVSFLNFTKGSAKLQSPFGVEACSLVDFILFAILLLFLILMSLISTLVVQEEYQAKGDCDYIFVEGDIIWTPRMIFHFLIFSFCIGFIAALVGLGGGTFFNPLLLSYGLSPIVASATGMYMVMLSNLSSCLLYAFSGVLDITFALWLGLFSVIGTIIGIKVINSLIKRTGKTYYLAIILAGVIVLSAIIIPIFGVYKTLKDIEKGIDVFDFDSI